MIGIEEIKEILSGRNLELIDSYIHDGKHRLEVRKSQDDVTLPGTIPVMGINFVHVTDGVIEKHGEVPYFIHVYECVFSNEVLENSIKLSFEELK